MDETLIIEKLGPIRKLEIKPRPLTLIIGEQASGKSLVAQLLYFFRGLESHVARIYFPRWADLAGWQTGAVKRILDGLRGLSLVYFTNPNEAALIKYKAPSKRFDSYNPSSEDIDWGIRLRFDDTIELSDSLVDTMNTWASRWTSYTTILGKQRESNQIFIPTERSMFTRLLDNEQSVLYADYQPEPFRRFADLLQKATKAYRTLFASLDEPSIWLQSGDQLKKTKDFVNACQRKALAGEAVVSDHDPSRWMFQIDTTSDPASPTRKLMPVQAAASGQMEAWPFFAIASTYAVLESNLEFYFEEPETHLHPRAQVEVIKVIAFLINMGHTFVVTTHSPFIAYVVDNMMQRFMAYKGQIPEGQVALNPDDVAAYRLRQSPDEPPEDIMDREDTKLLKLDELERVADELEAEFDELLEKAE